MVRGSWSSGQLTEQRFIVKPLALDTRMALEVHGLVVRLRIGQASRIETATGEDRG
jgi:hypothetical protein